MLVTQPFGRLESNIATTYYNYIHQIIRKEKYILFGYGRLQLIRGPIMRVTDNGIFFQISVFLLYSGASGLARFNFPPGLIQYCQLRGTGPAPHRFLNVC